MRRMTAVLTVPVVALLTQPLWAPQWGAGVLGEVAAFGLAGALTAIAVFFGLVALYCASLQRLMETVAPSARVRSPRSVWLMFAIPLNFVEDFFIVADIATSLHRDRRTPRGVVSFWRILGLTWCGLQIASLLPGAVGVASGLLALVAWAVHWGCTSSISRRSAVLSAKGA